MAWVSGWPGEVLYVLTQGKALMSLVEERKTGLLVDFSLLFYPAPPTLREADTSAPWIHVGVSSHNEALTRSSTLLVRHRRGSPCP